MNKFTFLAATFIVAPLVLFAQSIDNIDPIVIPQKQALVVDYIAEGAGASHIFGFFFLDIDTDKDGTVDFYETANGDDLDGDGLNNGVDPDDDNDGIPDAFDIQPIGVTSMPASFFRNGTVAEANGNSTTDYWQFIPNNLISGGPFDGYFEHPGAYLYVDNNSNQVPDILEYNTGDNQMPPYVVDKGVVTEHALLGTHLGVLGSWEYSGSPGANATERSHVVGSTIFYLCDDDPGPSQTNLYHANSPYGNTYSDIYQSANGQVDYNIYGTAIENSTLIPQEILGMDPQGEEFWKYRWFDQIVDANREVVYFAAVFWNNGGSGLNTYYSKTAFNLADASNYNPMPNFNTTGDDFGGSSIMNWYPRFQDTNDHNTLAAAVFGGGTTWAMIASSPTDGTSPVALNPTDQAWVDQFENWTTGTRIIQYIDAEEWLASTSVDANALINGRYGVDLTGETKDIIIRMDQERIPHFMVYTPTADPNSLVIGIEDLYTGGDRDYDDVIFYVTDFKGTKVSAVKSDHYTIGQCQDTIQYKVVIKNNGNPTANTIMFNDSPDANTALVVGSVSTTAGSVVLGNTPGNTAVQVNVGSIAEGDSAIILFTVDVNDGIYPGVTTVSNQGTISGTNFSDVLTSDLDQALLFQSTLTNLNEVLDLTAPTINCPPSLLMNTDPGSCDAIVNYTPPEGMDDCDGAMTSRVSGLSSGSIFQIGASTVSYMVVDAVGHSSNCSFTVTVEDNEAPIPSCSPTDFNATAVTVNDPFDIGDFGTATWAQQDIDGITITSIDNCGIVNRSITPTSFTCSDIGSTLVFTVTLTDQSDNSSTCTVAYTNIVDQTPPIAQCQDVTLQLGGNGDASLTAAEIDNGSSDLCGIMSLALSQTTFDCQNLGTPTVTLTVTDDSGNTNTCTATVTVGDEIDPVAQCQDVTLNLDANGNATVLPADVNNNSNDACGFSNQTVSPNSFDCMDLGPHTVTLTVTDQTSNTNSCTAVVTIADNTAPIVSCRPVDFNETVVIINDPINVGAVGTTTWTQQDIDAVTIASIDNCEIVSRTVSPTSFDCTDIGSTIVFTLTLTDQSDNASSCTITYTNIVDQTPPVAQCQDVTLPLDSNGSAFLSTNQVDNGSSDLCGIASLMLSQTSFTCQALLGTSTVTLTVTDDSNNTSTCTAAITVEDNLPPTASCTDIAVILVDRNTYTLNQSDIDAIAANSEDNCGNPNYFVTTGITDYDCDDRGAIFPVTLTVNDGSINTSSCTANVTIMDPNSVCNDPPVPICQDITIFTDNNCEASIIPQEVDGGSTDPDLDQLTFDLDHSGPFVPGNYTLTLSVSDGEFTETCTATVTVEDNTVPTAICRDVTVELDQQNGTGALTTAEVDNGSSDACGVTDLAISQNSFDCSELGELTITLTVSDVAANIQTCTATATVEGLPCGWSVDPNGIDCADAEATFDPSSNSFTLTTEGCYDPNHYRPTDTQGFIQQELCGDGEIIAQVTNVSGNGWAGISMRESNTEDAKMIQLIIDGSFLTRRELRSSTDGIAYAHLFQTLGKNWLRLTRTGNLFGAYHSLDGLNWEPVLITNIYMNSCINIGLMTMNGVPTGSVTGTFENVSITTPQPFTALGALNSPAQVQTEYDFAIFPNPATDEVAIQIDQFLGKNVLIKLYNNYGQIVLQHQVQDVQYPNERINISNLPPETYIVEVVSANQKMSKKLVKIE